MSFLLKTRQYLTRSLATHRKDMLRRVLSRSEMRGIQSLLYRLTYGTNLKVLAALYDTDKRGAHWYAQHYEKHFFPLRNMALNILEIGIGGYDDPHLFELCII